MSMTQYALVLRLPSLKTLSVIYLLIVLYKIFKLTRERFCPARERIVTLIFILEIGTDLARFQVDTLGGGNRRILYETQTLVVRVDLFYSQLLLLSIRSGTG